MQLPKLGQNYRHFVRAGFYTARQLVIVGQEAQAEQIRSCTQTLLGYGRACEDQTFKTSEHYADRDAQDRLADEVAQQVRLNLASRDVKAKNSAPYTVIFPDGLAWYTEAPLGDQVERYRTLISRCEANLAQTDPVLTELVPKLSQHLLDWEAAASALTTQLTQETVAKDAEDSCVATWTKLMNDTYYSLSMTYGKGSAERFFTKP